MKTLAIPKLTSTSGWKDISVHPIQERLVPLNFVREDCLFVLPYYHMKNTLGASPTLYIREMAMNLLVLAASKLPSGYKLVIFDAWRNDPHSPHYTGGSVHVTVMNENGELLDMGADFDEKSEKTPLRYFEEKAEQSSELSPDETTFLQNRRLLFDAMTSVGFTSFPEQWCHFDFGNQLWAKSKGKFGFYSGIQPDER